MYNSIYPIRKFQIDKRLKSKLKHLKKTYPNLLKDFEAHENAIGFFSFPIDFPIENAKSVLDLQGLMYKIMQSQNELIDFLHFWEKSRQIFSFEADLTKMLSMTNIDSIPWKSIKLPYDNFYISFGNFGQESFTSSDPNYKYEFIIDGAYIKRIKGQSPILPDDSIQIQFTSKLISPTYKKAISIQPEGYLLGEPLYEFILSGENDQSVKMAIQNGEKVYTQYCAKFDENNYAIAFEMAQKYGVTGNENKKLHLHHDKYLRGKDIIKPFLPTLFNLIFYLTQYPEKIVVKFQDNTPKKLLNKYKNAPSKKIKENTLNKINSHGYHRLKFVKSIIKKESLSKYPEREMSPHWRRGHWRNQPYGEGLNSNKYIWINPTMVRKDINKASSGHVYDVDK